MTKSVSVVLEQFGSTGRRNAAVILQNVTAYPFRLPEATIMCVYCCEDFPDPVDFRSHMVTEHDFVKVDVAFAHCREGYLKTDCTELRCRICSKEHSNLEHVARHLIDDHGFELAGEDFGLHPFKFKNDKLLCGICEKNFPCMRQLSRHMAAHYKNFTCESCGKAYTTNNALRQHLRFSHIDNERICRRCKETFCSLEAKKEHVASSPSCWSYRCGACSQRFITWNEKQAHLIRAHGHTRKSHSCPECREVFHSRNKYRHHFSTVHNNVCFVCSFCGRKFSTRRYLEQHNVVHSGIKQYQCEVCSRSFSRKDYLTKHVLIHSDARKFECALCSKKFNQKASFDCHMKTHNDCC